MLSTTVLKFSMGKIFIGREFCMHVKKNLGSNLYFYCFEYFLTTSVDYVFSKKFDGAFFGDKNQKCAAVSQDLTKTKTIIEKSRQHLGEHLGEKKGGETGVMTLKSPKIYFLTLEKNQK